MKLGIQFFPNLNPNPTEGNLWDLTRAFATTAEDAGLDSFWMWDHLMREPAGGDSDSLGMLECFVSLGGLAAITSRILLGQLVAAMPYRNPALMAKMATSLDVMSHGRAVLGVGAGWDRREMQAFGYEVEDVPTRMKRLEEGVQVALTMWQDRPASFAGRFYRLDRAYNDPGPVQRPHPSLMVGGSGERVTLRIAAQYADWSNVGGTPEQVAHRIGVLREHCRRLGRDPATLVYSNFLWAVVGRTQADAQAKYERLGANRRGFAGAFGDPEQLISSLREYAAAGSQHCIVQLTGETDPEAVRLLGERVAPALRTAGD